MGGGEGWEAVGWGGQVREVVRWVVVGVGVGWCGGGKPRGGGR